MSFDPESPSMPPGFEKWPREQRVNYIEAMHNRGQLVLGLVQLAELEEDGPRRGDPERLTVPELARIYELLWAEQNPPHKTRR
jgi:hypothetical protein